MIPKTVIEIRRGLCQSKCDVDPTDPCAACPNGHWGRYQALGCDDPNHVIPSSQIIGRPSNPSRVQPGSLLSAVIFKITGKRACGACSARMRTMNENGWWWCWKNRATIVGWLVEEAKKRGHEIDENAVLGLFKAAFKESKTASPARTLTPSR
jgi:hypothetical protein